MDSELRKELADIRNWQHQHGLEDSAAFLALNEKLDDHMKELQPYIQGAAGLGLVWKVLVAIGGGALLIYQLKQMLWH